VYFWHIQNNLQIEGNLKIIVYLENNTKEIIINHKVAQMVRDVEG